MKVNLILLKLDKLVVTLGMDFLNRYHEVFDCSKNEVLREPKKCEVKWVGNKKVGLARIISASGKEIVNKEDSAYLAHEIDTELVKWNPKNVPIVCEYLHVFSK